MKRFFLIFLLFGTSVASAAPASKIDRQPGVVILKEFLAEPVMLDVVKDSTVFDDKNGSSRLGVLVKGQKVELESMTERAYKVRGKGRKYGVAGWVSPKAFASSDPDFIENLKKVHARFIAVQKLIDAGEIAIGMTMSEVGRSIGEPRKRSATRTEKGKTSKWEYVTTDIEKHYQTVQDRFTGQIYRRFSHSTVIETSRIDVEFTDGVVSSIFESEDKGNGNVRIVVPPIVFAF